MKIVCGEAFYCGNCVNTDVISPGRFEPYQGKEHLASIALIDYKSVPPFVDPKTNKSRYKVIFAGKEFGCGSSRETAPQALFYAGVQVIIAHSFARIFFRNCINMGMIYPIIFNHSFDSEIIGQEVMVNFTERFFTVNNKKYFYNDLGSIEEIITAGGLIKYTKHKLGLIA